MRAIVIVTEGASRSLLEKWCKRGCLPAFSQLLEEGVGGRFMSDIVPYEPSGLMSAFTGYSPSEHGWYSYWEVHSPTYQPRVLTSADETRPLLWNHSHLKGKRFAVINVCGTHPPKPLDGWLVSYPMRQTLRATYPRNLQLALSRQGIPLVHDVAVWYSGQAREAFLSGVLKADQARFEAALSCWNTTAASADALILNLTAIDRVSHFYWHELEEESPVPEQDGAIFQAFASCDRILQRWIGEVDSEVSLLAFSEIGFGPLRAYCRVNDALVAAGFQTREAKNAGAKILWPETLAFEAVQGSHGVNINTVGRYRDGKVSADDYVQVREEVIEVLRNAINPHTGLELFRRVLPREAVYSGAKADLAPDIVLVPADERYQPLGDPFWADTVNRTLQSGWHRRDSFLAGIGPTFEGVETGRCATALDIAPTICQMLGVEPLKDWKGHSLGLEAG